MNTTAGADAHANSAARTSRSFEGREAVALSNSGTTASGSKFGRMRIATAVHNALPIADGLLPRNASAKDAVQNAAAGRSPSNQHVMKMTRGLLATQSAEAPATATLETR